jgi:ADP-heptose:LPS heptosyltransferase
MSRTPKKILVFCLSGLGDAIMASPALMALAERRDKFSLTLLTMFPMVREYLTEQPFTKDVRFVDFIKGRKSYVFRELWKLRRERFDISILPYAHNRIEYNGVSAFIGARCRIGFRYTKQRHVNLPILNNVVLDEDVSLHVVEENLRWAAHLRDEKWELLPADMIFRHAPASVQQAEEFLRANRLTGAAPLIGMHPSCNVMKNQQNRCWPPGQFVQFIERMGKRLPSARFLLFEGPMDAQLAGMIRQNAESVSVARMLPVPVVGALIRRCNLFVSNCSGLIHAAAACQVPTVGIYGPTNPVWDRPWGKNVTVLSRHLPCSPCFYYSSRPLDCPAKLDYACVRELRVEDVERAALELLKPVRV